MRELTTSEISNVSGAGGCSDSDGFFEALGCALDNPFTAAGEIIDTLISGDASDDGTGYYDPDLNVPFAA